MAVVTVSNTDGCKTCWEKFYFFFWWWGRSNMIDCSNFPHYVTKHLSYQMIPLNLFVCKLDDVGWSVRCVESHPKRTDVLTRMFWSNLLRLTDDNSCWKITLFLVISDSFVITVNTMPSPVQLSKRFPTPEALVLFLLDEPSYVVVDFDSSFWPDCFGLEEKKPPNCGDLLELFFKGNSENRLVFSKRSKIARGQAARCQRLKRSRDSNPTSTETKSKMPRTEYAITHERMSAGL